MNTSEYNTPLSLLKIQQLRQKSRDPDYCEQVTKLAFDDIISLLFDREDQLYNETIDILASISNIILINRDLHSNYFTQKYSNKVLRYLDALIKSDISLYVSKMPPDIDYDFTSLIPIYRLIFLILYDALDNVNDEVVGEIFSLLIIGFKFCDGNFTKFKHNDHYKVTFTEILKSLYTLNHKYKYGGDLIKNENLTLDVIITINDIFVFKPNPINLLHNGFLLVKSLLNFLLGTFIVTDSLPQSSNLYHVELNTLKNHQAFLHNLITLLQFQIKNYFHESSIPEFDLSDLNNLMILINFISEQLQTQYLESGDGEDVTNNVEKKDILSLHITLKNGILPVDGSKYIYNKLVILLSMSNNSKFSSSGSFFGSEGRDSIDFTQMTYSKSVILQVMYNLSWNPASDKESQMTEFLSLIGYLNAESFIAEKQLSIPRNIVLDQYLHPNPKYLDQLVELNNYMMNNESPLNSIFNGNSPNSFTSNSNVNDDISFTDAEKEIEAEKLFVIFDRMEKTGVFQNFKNPIREWQQLGKFENLPDENGSVD